MALSDIPKDFNQEVNKFIEELELWIPLIRLLLLPEEEFCNFWEKFSKLHEEKKIYSVSAPSRPREIGYSPSHVDFKSLSDSLINMMGKSLSWLKNSMDT